MRKALLLGAIAAALSGCLSINVHKSETADGEVVYAPAANMPAPTTMSSQDLEMRYRAALQISNFSQRDTTLALLAADAASCGETQIVNKSLAGISDFSRRDKATEDAAMRLAAAGSDRRRLRSPRRLVIFRSAMRRWRNWRRGSESGLTHVLAGDFSL